MASRFWKAQPVSGAIVSVASPPQVRLTVASTTGMTTGDVRVVSGVVGTTEANGTWTITVIDATHIDLQGTTFANLYTSGGIVVGKLDTTNTNNWVSTSGGTDYGQTVPGASDTATFDGSSGGGTVTLNFGGTWTLQSVAMGAFTGTWDNSVNNNNVTVTASGGFNGSGSGARTIKLGTATYTLSSAVASTFTFATVTNLTLTASGATISFTGGAAVKTFTSGASQTYGTVAFSASSSGGYCAVVAGGAYTINTLTITAPNYATFNQGITVTVGTALNAAGSSSSQIGISSNVLGATATVALPASQTAQWCALRDMTFTGNALVASSSFDLGHNTLATISPPPVRPFPGLQAIGEGLSR